MHDAIGHPLEVGTKVLTPAHYCVAYTEIATVTKVTRLAVYVDMYCTSWNYELNHQERGVRSLRRRPDQMIAIGAQYKHNQKRVPENLL